MKIYDYNIGDVVEISDAQFDFMQALIKHSGRMEAARKEYPISEEQLLAWKLDKVFWPCLEGHITILIRSHGLTQDYVKDFLLSTLENKKEPTEMQMKAINVSVRALGMGLAERRGFNGAVTVGPDNTTIVFNDGIKNDKS